MISEVVFELPDHRCVDWTNVLVGLLFDETLHVVFQTSRTLEIALKLQTTRSPARCHIVDRWLVELAHWGVAILPSVDQQATFPLNAVPMCWTVLNQSFPDLSR